jgi:hypothetical protein
MIEVIHCTHKIDCRALLGEFCVERHYDRLITTNTDFYCGGEPIFKLRKQAFTAREQALTYRALRGAATTSNRRGLAAGPIDYSSRIGNRDWVSPLHSAALKQMGADVSKLNTATRTQACVWLKKEVLKDHPQYEGWFGPWLASTQLLNSEDQRAAAQHVVDCYVSKTTYPMPVMSGVAGYMDANDHRNPYGRMTPYTARYPKRFSLCLPYVKKLDGIFRQELPQRWKKQRQAADKIDQRHLIDRTSFTTLTTNHNFRTAAHRDEGDLPEGFSSLAAFTGPEAEGGGVASSYSPSIAWPSGCALETCSWWTIMWPCTRMRRSWETPATTIV